MRLPDVAVYNRRGYIAIVSSEAERSMQSVAEEVKCLPNYQSQGEVSSSSIQRNQDIYSICDVVGNH